jgi:hypothetical protein
MSLHGLGIAARMLFVCSPKVFYRGTGRGVMSVVLLVVGALTTLAGLLLVASGVTMHEGTFDGEAITPGTIAAIGGLLLIGMGLAVRELRRIERTLAERATARAAGAAETSENAAAEAPEAAVRIPFPGKQKRQLQVAAPSLAQVPPERLSVKFPNLQGREEGPVVEEQIRAVTPPAAAGNASGGMSASATPRLDVRAHPMDAPDGVKASGIGAFLAAGRSRKDGAAVPAQAALAVSPPEPAPQAEAAVERTAAGRPAATVTALKSGVLEGMPYTLYSDGSIEAQLPQGTLRFGSITALREHIDSSA